jgi:hypothetical protein
MQIRLYWETEPRTQDPKPKTQNPKQKTENRKQKPAIKATWTIAENKRFKKFLLLPPENTQPFPNPAKIP